MTNLERWRYYLQDLESPDIFIDWTFYFIIAAALQRNICLEDLPHEVIDSPLFPNQYLIFIGPTRTGKSSAADKGLWLYHSYGGFEDLESIDKRLINVGPSSTSLEGLIRYMNENVRTRKLEAMYNKPDGKTRYYVSTPMAFFATKELATLFREHTDDTVHWLAQGWECGDFHRNTKGQGVDFIKAMCLSLFGCATPEWVRDISKSGLLKAGFASRTIFVWASKPRHLKLLYKFDAQQKAAFEEIRKHIIQLTKLYGAARLTEEAKKYITEWYEGGGTQIKFNNSKVLDDYYAGKKIHALKLTMAMHFADSLELTIGLEPFKKALALLERTEKDMHLALLGTSTENPAAKIAGMIEQILETDVNGNPYMRKVEILSKVYNYCPEGKVTFEEALSYLEAIGRIEGGSLNGKIAYKLKEEQKRKGAVDEH